MPCPPQLKDSGVPTLTNSLTKLKGFLFIILAGSSSLQAISLESALSSGVFFFSVLWSLLLLRPLESFSAPSLLVLWSLPLLRPLQSSSALSSGVFLCSLLWSLLLLCPLESSSALSSGVFFCTVLWSLPLLEFAGKIFLFWRNL